MRKSYKELQEALTLDSLLKKLRGHFGQFSDHRSSNSSYRLGDILMSGFAMFSLKYASLLQFESQTEVERQNLHSLYGIEKLCNDSQMRKVLDKVDPEGIKAMYGQHLKELTRLGISQAYRYYQDYLVVAIDGVTHFESKSIHCSSCLERHHKDGSISYSHSMLSPRGKARGRMPCWSTLLKKKYL